jgi:hypothetical protein
MTDSGTLATADARSAVKRQLRLLIALGAALALTITLLPGLQPAAEAFPIESHCGTETGNTSVEGFISHDQLGRDLERIERSSQGRVEVEEAGRSFNDREIWTATVGHGDQVMLVQSDIHGNEKHGTIALLNLLSTLGNNSQRSAEIREEITLVAVPMMNPDGSELDQRRNDMSWEDTVSLHPQLEGAPRAWYHNARLNGFDVNRDFNPDLDYTPRAEDLPGTSAGVGFYLTPAAQTVRDVYAGLEDEFGNVDVFVDLHNQAPCYREGDNDHYSPLSISGRFISDPDDHGDWPEFDEDDSLRANLAVYDALQQGNSPFGKVTLYPQNINLPGTALGSFSLRGSAVVLFETSGQTQHIGQKRMGMLAKQVETGLGGIVDALTDGTFDDLDPERYDDIPPRRWAN